MKFVKRLLFVLFWELIVLLLLFEIDPQYYIAWVIFAIVFFFMMIFISFRVFPTKKEEQHWEKLKEEYLRILSRTKDCPTKAKLLSFTCPACSHESHYWDFLNEGACPKCDSKLWTTVIAGKEADYFDLFEKHQELDSFLSHLSFRQKKKLKKLFFMDKLEP
ncbi:MAG: hypothetical protein CVV50_01095 [Spirochaetae bacterium HGW-Spirochaetae-6]|nr:MAG: hypothetical protein CVV50_01095 [Spirochaetae bacterium HGW-Spirochaetae-6]